MDLRYVLIELSNVLIELSNILKVERFNQFRFELRTTESTNFLDPMKQEARKSSQQSRRTLRLNQAKSIPNGPP